MKITKQQARELLPVTGNDDFDAFNAYLDSQIAIETDDIAYASDATRISQIQGRIQILRELMGLRKRIEERLSQPG
jgi:hypothetical protein